MSLLCWNCRGLGLSRAVTALRSLIRTTKPDLVFLSETKKTNKQMQSIKYQLGFQNGFFVERQGKGGGLAFLWNNNITVEVQNYTIGHIDCIVRIEGHQPWRFTGFYGNSKAGLRVHSWNLLRRLSNMLLLPWLCAGDFNQVLLPEEKQSINPANRTHMRQFKEALIDCNLSDLGFKGSQFTWRDNPRNPTVLERLDRAVSTQSWKTCFPHYSVQHVAATHSDHLPLHILLNGQLTRKKRGPGVLRFDPYWLRDEECHSLFESFWTSPADSQSMQNLVVDIRTELRSWASNKYGNLSKKVKEAKKLLEEAMANKGTHDEIAYMQQELSQLEDLEELYWSQRSRADWLHQGDRNTSYFHHKASARKERNWINGILDEQGQLREDEATIMEIFRNYYINLFSSQNTLSLDSLDLPFKTLSATENERLAAPYTAEEVRVALKQIPGKKAPGPDGLHMIFLQQFWDTVGSDVTRIVLDILNHGADLSPFNHSFICLLPKIKNPTRTSEFRPIGLCNSIYKLVSRILVNRLKPVIGCVIDEAQSAFVQNRLITDNAIIAFEAFHNLQSQNIGAEQYMALKLDMSKAFDRVEWKYLHSVMRAMNFPVAFIDIIMRCVTSVSISVLVNGSPSAPFTPTRGIRQGDPLSPFLFIICSEGLSALVRKMQLQDLWQGMKFGMEGPEVSHLLFADDSLFFARADIHMVSRLKNTLDLYSQVSGQLINYDKSNAYFHKNVSDDLVSILCAELQVQKGDGSGKYLGIPFITRRTKSTLFNYVVDRIRKKMHGWKEKYLTAAGKEVLIKSVLQAIPTYCMQSFLLPVSICNQIESLIRRFWWNHNKDGRKIHWKSWSQICKSKSGGGLGFRHLRAFNVAMLAKQAWRLVQSPNSLVASVLRGKYFPQGDFLSAGLGSTPSYVWKSICEGRKLLEKGTRYRVGDGLHISIWKDRWLLRQPSFKPLPVHQSLLPDGLVNDLIVDETMSWNEAIINDLFLPFDAQEILSIPLSMTRPADRLIWHFAKNGSYTVKSGYYIYMRDLELQSEAPSSSSDSADKCFWKRLWGLPLQPKVKHFAWRLCQNALPTSHNISKRMPMDPTCQLCLVECETAMHCMFDCSWTHKVWASVRLKMQPRRHMDFRSLLDTFMRENDDSNSALLITICWLIWKSRCSWVFESKQPYIDGILWQAQSLSSEFSSCKLSRGVKQPKGHQHTRWKPPEEGFIKVNVDASQANSGAASFGVIARDSRMQILFAEAGPLPTGTTIELGELLAIREGLRRAHSYGWKHVVIESDSQIIISQLKNARNPLDPYGTVADECLVLCSNFDICCFEFVRREGNKPAHLLACHGLSLDHTVSWGNLPPLNVLDATAIDAIMK